MPLHVYSGKKAIKFGQTQLYGTPRLSHDVMCGSNIIVCSSNIFIFRGYIIMCSNIDMFST